MLKTILLIFWKANKNNLPTLSTLARAYLCPPASSTASEREFKVGKLIQKDKIRLLPKNVEMLLFLKYNLRAVSYSTELPTPPENFILPNSKMYDTKISNLYSESDSD